MYMAYSQSNTTTTLQGSAHSSKGMTIKRGYTKLLLRFILIAAILGTVFSFGAIVQAYAGEGASTASTTPSVQPIAKSTPQVKVVVQSGDTLWDIASSHLKKGENTRSYTEKIKSFNHLTSSSLKEGQVLLLP
ncbi:hypothetical protein A8709_25775 [Paenibacillus pectinilyticus]|uniref:LysM domain-containing protein n=1 Tax=Paenibacillus pectinilyticus TaxID=512399 RepID=A0A1C1A144_9BACL|nr:LysM peptidoglycan-binding domain-containing protein [Paenibacillus pectinilyticus]OCT14243.1 hypothetical protein A8709_25775 [Paenibacillus pectinilyticus]